MARFHLAQLNIAQLMYPADAPEFSGFVNNLDRINALAEAAGGFVWRLVSPIGDTEVLELFTDEYIVNMSVWENIQALHNYVYGPDHVAILRRKKEWFHPMKKASMVLWWIPAGHIPTLNEAKSRLQNLQENGPNPQAFTFKKDYPAPEPVLV